MVSSLTELVRTYPDNQVCIDNWVDGVFPLILDVEQKAAEKVLENVWELLFSNLVEFSECRQRKHFLPWKILEATERLKMTKYLSRACGSWAKEGLIKPEVLSVLRSHVHSGDNSNYAWLLLGLLSGHVALDDPRFVQVWGCLRILFSCLICQCRRGFETNRRLRFFLA